MDIEDLTDLLHDDCVCSVCYAEFLDKEDLEVHVKQIHLTEASKNRFCEICTRIYPDIEEYALHIRDMHLPNIVCCRYCIRLFISNTDLQRHEKNHKAAVLFPKISCSQCECVFENKNDVRDHELKDHANSDYGVISKEVLPILSSLLCMNAIDFFTASHYNFVYTCVYCRKTTPDINLYLKHHTDNKCYSYACDICCRVYRNKFNLRYHLKQHLTDKACNTNDKNLCKKCRRPFKGPLKLHLKSCKGMTCGLCDLTFKSVNDFTNHRIKHQSKALECEYCIYCQRQMIGSVMKKHIERAHKNEVHLYKYHCTDCNRVFKHPKLLFAHFYSKHKDLHPYTCKICDQTFRIRKSFTLHIKLIHKSIGVVKFDNNFHVYFSEKTLDEPSNTQSDESVINNDGHRLENNESHKDSDKSIENSNGDKNIEICEIELEIQAGDFKNDTLNNENDDDATTMKDSTDINDKHSQEFINIQMEKLESDDSNKCNENITNKCDLDVTIVKKPIRKHAVKHKRTFTKKVKSKKVIEEDISSDDSDMPLRAMCNKIKSNQTVKKAWKSPWNHQSSKTKNFVCIKCNKNCYTYQNYHRHVALHAKNEIKVCIKCNEKFDSVNKLNEHIKNEHSSSKLTETLKKLIEKRKNTEVPNTAPEINEDKIVSASEKFRNTIKKVEIDRNGVKASIKLVDKDKISVKKYLENFTPEHNTDIKITMIKNATASNTTKHRRPFIKLTKFIEPTTTTIKPTLKMPTKFSDDSNEKCQVSIKLVSDYVPPTMVFGSKTDNLIFNDYETSEEAEVDDKHTIPEVAQEVMLVGEETNNVVHTMNLKNLPDWHKEVKIAHLSTVAPYYKISKINIDKDQKFTLVAEEPEVPPPNNITLANGQKLVRANPFAHLLDTKKIDELKKSKKSKCAYKPRLSNVAEAITKAMEKLESTSTGKEKKKL